MSPSVLPARPALTLGPEVRSERLSLSAGGLRIDGTLADAPIDPSKLSLAIYVPENRNPLGKLVYPKAKAGEIIGLPEGAYHIVSTYLDTVGGRFVPSVATNSGKSAAPAPPTTLPSNSIVNADIKVASGKLIDVTLRHRCATLTLKLVNKPGAEALANTTFTVLTPGGDVIRELVGAFPSMATAPRANTSSSPASDAKDLSIDLPGAIGSRPRRGSRCTIARRSSPEAEAEAEAAPAQAARRLRRQGLRLSMQTFFVEIKCALGGALMKWRARWPKRRSRQKSIRSPAISTFSPNLCRADVDIGHFVGEKGGTSRHRRHPHDHHVQGVLERAGAERIRHPAPRLSEACLMRASRGALAGPRSWRSRQP